MNNMLIKNTNKLAFKKFKQENHELKLELQTLTYNMNGLPTNRGILKN